MRRICLISRSFRATAAKGERRMAMAASRKKTIVRDEFVIRDSGGRVRVKLAMDANGTALSLCDEGGHARVSVVATTSAALFSLLDDNLRDRASVAVTSDGPTLTLHDAAGKARAWLGLWENLPALTFHDDGGRTCLLIRLSPSGPRMDMFDAQGNLLWSAPPSKGKPGCSARHTGFRSRKRRSTWPELK